MRTCTYPMTQIDSPAQDPSPWRLLQHFHEVSTIRSSCQHICGCKAFRKSTVAPRTSTSTEKLLCSLHNNRHIAVVSRGLSTDAVLREGSLCEYIYCTCTAVEHSFCTLLYTCRSTCPRAATVVYLCYAT